MGNGAMHHYLTVATVQQRVCLLFRNLAIGNVENQTKMVECGCVLKVLECLQAHVDSEAVAGAALGALINLTKSAQQNVVVPATQSRAHDDVSASLPLVKSVLDKHSASNLIIRRTFNLLVNLTSSQPDTQTSVIEIGFIPTILEALKQHSDEALLTSTIGLIISITSSSPSNRVVLSGTNCLSLILDVVKNIENLREKGCWALRNLCRSCKESQQKALEDSEFIAILSGIVQARIVRESDGSRVVDVHDATLRHAMFALWEVTFGVDGNAERDFLNILGESWMADMMALLDDVSVGGAVMVPYRVSVCAAIQKLCETALGRQRLGESGCIQYLIRWLSSSRPEVVVSAFSGLSALAFCSPQNKAKIESQFDNIASGMFRNTAFPDVQSAAFLLLTYLTLSNAELKEQSKRLGLRTHIQEMLSLYPKSNEIQTRGTTVITGLDSSNVLNRNGNESKVLYGRGQEIATS
eukprot:c8873_g1_i1.p1 GENE.c8873_g1_i1~~c8873_g1_i1.p1  ORF type:complete len:468 (+),score=150.05 c8873_g1_i1:1-1404(+)